MLSCILFYFILFLQRRGAADSSGTEIASMSRPVKQAEQSRASGAGTYRHVQRTRTEQTAGGKDGGGEGGVTTKERGLRDSLAVANLIKADLKAGRQAGRQASARRKKVGAAGDGDDDDDGWVGSTEHTRAGDRH